MHKSLGGDDSKRIRVPKHDITVQEHELFVLHTPTFQRLFRINQLGLAYLVYPYATHSRAAHCLDTLHEAQQILDVLIDKGMLHSSDDRWQIDVTRMACLLHDIGHIPFSHTLEDENYFCDPTYDDSNGPPLKKHEQRGSILLERLLREIPKPWDKPDYALDYPSEAQYDKIRQLITEVPRVLRTIDTKPKLSTSES